MMSSQTHTHQGQTKKSCKNKIKPMSIIHFKVTSFINWSAKTIKQNERKFVFGSQWKVITLPCYPVTETK